MRLLAFALLVACGKNSEEELPPPIAFVDSASAVSLEASIDDDSANLLATWSALGQFFDLLISDNTIKNTFYVQGGLGAAPTAAYGPCWSLPSPGIAGLEYDVDLSGCGSQGYAGTLHVEDTPQGPIVFTFTDTTFLDWTLTGGVAFASEGDRTWSVFPSDENGLPTGGLAVDTNEGPLNLTIDASLTITGFPTDDFVWSGSAGDGARTVAIAGAGEPTVYSEQPAECSCPTAGGNATDVVVALTSIEVDLDDLEAEDNSEDDSAIIFSVPSGPAGEAVFAVGPTCGTHDVSFGPVSVTLGSAELTAGVDASCDSGNFDDGTCTRLREAASQGEVTIEIGGPMLDNALTEDASNRFDEGICFSGY